jgi:hypothetical protein
MLTDHEKELQRQVDALSGILRNQAAVNLPMIINAMSFRKAEAIAGNPAARQELRDFLVAYDLDSIRAAMLGLRIPAKVEQD